MRDFVTNIAIVFQSVGSLLLYFAVHVFHVYHVFVYMREGGREEMERREEGYIIMYIMHS